MVPFMQALDVVRQTKIAEVLGTDFNKEQNNKERRRSSSRDRSRRDSLDSVAYEKSGGNGDEVSIGVEWSGDGVSMGTAMQVFQHKNLLF